VRLGFIQHTQSATTKSEKPKLNYCADWTEVSRGLGGKSNQSSENFRPEKLHIESLSASSEETFSCLALFLFFLGRNNCQNGKPKLKQKRRH